MFLFAFQLAIDYGIKFLETSAKSSTNVEEVRKKEMFGDLCLWAVLKAFFFSDLVNASCELFLHFVSFCASDFYVDPGCWISSTQPPHGIYWIAQLRFTNRRDIQSSAHLSLHMSS